jgi:hypothetical protein
MPPDDPPGSLLALLGESERAVFRLPDKSPRLERIDELLTDGDVCISGQIFPSGAALLLGHPDGFQYFLESPVGWTLRVQLCFLREVR